MLAVKSGNLKIIDTLISNEINMNEKDKHGNTALHLACARTNNSAEIVNLLLSKKSDLNLVNDMGLTPIKIAIQVNNAETVSLLMKIGAGVFK
jgi:ankyrin repeat protein